jgi:protein TonB
MRGAITGSALVHLAVVLALMLVRTPTPIVIGGPETVTVALLDASAMAALAAAAPAPAPAAEDEGVRLDPPRPDETPRPQARREPPRPPAPPADRPAKPTSDAGTTNLPMASIGGPGLRGSVAVDARDFEFAYYLRLVRDHIARHWSPPAGLATGGRPVQAVVQFRVARSGQITGVRVEESSGIDFFDRAASRAVTISDPLPPLPLGWPGSDLGVHFGFEYTGP